MKRSFDEDSRLHLNKPEGGPEGYDNGEFLKKWGMNKHSTSFVISNEKRDIGAVILWINWDKVNFLGSIFLDLDQQNIGLGLKVWKKIEKMYPETVIWKTETPGFSKRNHHFYVNKCGFHIIKIENYRNWEEENYLREKVMKTV